jgi:hypothetical protein
MTVGNQYGYLCPNCEKGTELLVRTMAHILLRPRGFEVDDASLLDSSHVDCLICGWEGIVGELGKTSLKKEPRAERGNEKFRKER